MRIPTTAGPGEVHAYPARDPVGTVVFTHGSAGSVDAPDLRALLATGQALGWSVLAVTQPFRLAGRRAPGPAHRQDAAWVELVTALDPVVPLVLAGRSNGARVACRTATRLGAVGVVALAFPVHPPGHPERDRSSELAAPLCPVLVVQGDRDPFGRPARRRGRRVAVVAGADHALRDADGVIPHEVGRFLRRLSAPGA